MGIYAVEKADYAEFRRDKCESITKLKELTRQFKSQGFRDEAFDLKELSGTSKNLVYNAIAKKKRQAPNFILDISKSPLDENEIARQIEEIYWSRHTMFVQKIIVIKDEKIRKIYKRNREK